MRTDPFRELGRLTQQLAGTTARPATMAMDAYRQGVRQQPIWLPGSAP